MGTVTRITDYRLNKNAEHLSKNLDDFKVISVKKYLLLDEFALLTGGVSKDPKEIQDCLKALEILESGGKLPLNLMILVGRITTENLRGELNIPEIS
jgi:hypothetical protein